MVVGGQLVDPAAGSLVEPGVDVDRDTRRADPCVLPIGSSAVTGSGWSFVGRWCWRRVKLSRTA
jgi:hypothetical protein